MKGRVFTPEFKLSIVQQVLNGEKSIPQLCREFSLSDSLIHNWKKLYREKGEAAFSAPTTARGSKAELSVEEQELVELRNRVAQLERFIGKPAVEIDILKKYQRSFPLYRPTLPNNRAVSRARFSDECW